MSGIDPRPWYARARAQMAGLVAAAGPERMEAATPCTEYAVRDLLGHILGGCDRWALIGDGGDGLALEPMVRGVPDESWITAYEEASGRVEKAWAPDARMDAAVAVPWGTVPGRIGFSGYVMETAAHAWDLARALGVDTAGLDQELAEFVLGFAGKVLPAERRGPEVPFAAVLAAADDAAPADRLAGWLGRDPGWTPAA
ncbi:MAG TPA: TIGR03086 family metal-binding protein [Actinospica sp.]|nr:TIGR03086 family metal-binding protein [Actinospica sp.]